MDSSSQAGFKTVKNKRRSVIYENHDIADDDDRFATCKLCKTNISRELTKATFNTINLRRHIEKCDPFFHQNNKTEDTEKDTNIQMISEQGFSNNFGTNRFNPKHPRDSLFKTEFII